MPRLEGKVIVITGAASGIGQATAVRCAAEGARVVALDRATGCDVTSVSSIEAALEGIGVIDGLVNSAGIATRFPLADQDEAGWDAVLDVNLKGSYLCARHAIPRMPRGASILHVSSTVGLTGFRNRAAYTASKGAIIALTRNMALDYAPRGIRVNCICPGFTRTGLTQGIFADPERRSRIESMHPLGRMGEPEDIANAALFLLSEEASWITGIALPVDGGIGAGHQHDI